MAPSKNKTNNDTIKIDFSEPDIYGQVHPVETDALIRAKLEEFHAAIEAVPLKKKSSLALAQEKCPNQLTDDFHLQFLRCELFDVRKAVKRYLKYWEVRRDICGDDKAFLPLRLGKGGPVQDDNVALQLGMLQLVGAKDPSGRNILFLDTSRQDWSVTNVHSMARASAYILMAALEDTTTQQKGIVLLSWPAREQFHQMRPDFIKILASCIKGAMPVRLSGVHVCQPPLFFRVVYPICSMVLGERLTKRIRLHPGTQEDMAKSLEPYGLTKENLPQELGGTVVCDIDQWLQERQRQGK